MMSRTASCGFLVLVLDQFVLEDMQVLSAGVLDKRVVTFDFSTMQRANFPSEHFKEYKVLPTLWPESQCWLDLGCPVRDSSWCETKA